MKRAALLAFLILASGFCISSASLDTAIYDFNLTVNITGGTMNAHVPVSTAWQTVTPLENYATTSDDSGAYVNAQDFQVYRFRVEVNSAKARPLQDAGLPLTGLDSSVQKFLQPTENIQSTDQEISSLAQQIIGNASTELEATNRIVKWIYENIEYVPRSDLQTRISSKQVLQTKQGVCGDFSSLTAALLRSQGIPAKYINGLLYTGEEFQSHAWLEIYVPNSGWTPIDPTNGKTMPTAALIRIMQGVDPLDLKDTIFYTQGTPAYSENSTAAFVNYTQFSGLLNTSVTIKPQRAAFNQTVKITLNMENLQNQTLTPEVSLKHTAELEINDTFKNVVLPPHSKTTLEWAATTPANLDLEKLYTFFVVVEGPGFSHNSSLYASKYVLKPPSVLSVSTRTENKALILAVELRNEAPYDTNATVSVDSDLGRTDKIVELKPWETKNAEFKFPSAGATEYTFRINTSAPDALEFFSKEFRVNLAAGWEQSLIIPFAAIIAVVIILVLIKLLRR